MAHSFESHLSPGDVAELDQWGAQARDSLAVSVAATRDLIARHNPAVAAGLVANHLAEQPPGHLALGLAWALVTLAEHPEVA